MENKLEQLLNKLIEKGWCPMWKEYTWPHKPFISLNGDNVHWLQFYYNERWDWDYRLQKVFTLREIVSINSGLWQFVCEHWMVKTYMNIEHESRRHSDKKHTPVWAFDNQSYYYLIESSLKDESELESFILDNIKIEWNDL